MGPDMRDTSPATLENPMDELLRVRLRLPLDAKLRVKAIRRGMELVDWFTRNTTGQAFFALRDTERVLRELNGRIGPELLTALLNMKGGTTVTAHGLENVPETGAVVIGSTHPIGTFDFIVHAGALLDRRPDLKVVANREAEQFLGADMIIPVDFSRSDKVTSARRTLSEMEAHLQIGGALLVFGSGRVPGMKDGLLVEPEWRTGITRMSAATGAPIIPASPDMRNSRHYYRTRRMAYLLSGGNEGFARTFASLRYVSELMSKLGGTYTVHYSEPVAPGTAPDVLQKIAEGLVPGLYR